MKEVVDDVVLKKNSELLLKKLQLLDYQNYFLLKWRYGKK